MIEFFDASTIFDSRMLVPVYVAAVLAGCVRVRGADRGAATGAMGGGRGHRSSCSRTGMWTFDSRSESIRRVWGATITTWRESHLVAAVNELPPGTEVWTNAVLQLPWVSAEPARALPRPRTRIGGAPWAGYDSALAAIPSGAYVAQFGDSATYQGAAVRDLVRTRGLDVVAETPEGALYRVKR